MKKIFWILALAGLVLVSCKKDESATNESTENLIPENEEDQTAETPRNEHNLTITIPEFSDPEVQNHANELVKFYHQIREAEAEGNQEKLDELLKQQVLYHQKQQEVLKPLSTEEKEKFREWSADVAKAALQ